MANKNYQIEYLSTFVSQFNNILYYIKYELKNEIAANNFYNKVINKINLRSISPESYKVFKILKKENVKYYKIQVNSYTIFYIVKGNVMEVRRIYYSRRNFKQLI